MRGKREVRTTPRVTLRITPAGAGKTLLLHGTRGGKRDHPRRCGENRYASSYIGNLKGSPPQVRGKPLKRARHLLVKRITPAGAGKTRKARFAGRPIRDHPRRCGENHKGQVLFLSCLGSPPQVRGKLRVRFWAAIQYRITPAGAGKTNSFYMGIKSGWDHPRRCGENRRQRLSAMSALGSPPQVRGKRYPKL